MGAEALQRFGEFLQAVRLFVRLRIPVGLLSVLKVNGAFVIDA